MIDAQALLADARRLVGTLEADIRTRVADDTDLESGLRSEHKGAVAAGRSGLGFEAWRDERVTQAAVAWVLATVFVRFCEDNGLVGDARLAGQGERLGHARDHQTLYFRQHPADSDREYLLSVFGDVAALPGMGALFDPAHNPLWALPVSADGATALLDLVRRQDPASGRLVFDFTDPGWDTRFLGDLYQDLSDDARKRYALLQTPVFVEEFLLDRTLEPALDVFGLEDTTLIDPACGSGHFLLGAFSRLLGRWQSREPGTSERVLAQRALDAIAGVDLNPFAVAIARFRLLVAALRAAGISRLADAPDFRLRLAVGDSLLHGRAPGRLSLPGEAIARADVAHVYRTEDAAALEEILGQRYAVVVGNPPYVTVKDPALNQAYRDRFPESCRGKYAAAVPFTERFLDLTLHESEGRPAGFVGMITANSFMKREMGKNLIEKVFPAWDLTHVIDTSGAYIPGHGTPTVILVARARPPLSTVIRTAMGIRGEPSRPVDPSKGHVWTAIVDQVDDPGSESDYVSVADTPRVQFAIHPWSIGGGGAADLKNSLDEEAAATLQSMTKVIGVVGISGSDDLMLADKRVFLRFGIESDLVRPLVEGEVVRDFRLHDPTYTYFPYDTNKLLAIDKFPKAHRRLWPFRAELGSRRTFSKKSYFEEGRPWWEWHQVTLERLQTPLCLTFAFVATHNHFVLDREGKVFNRSAPVIKLPGTAVDDDYFGLLGVLNSAVSCFWIQQTFHNAGAGGGARVAQGYAAMGDESFLNHYVLDVAKLKRFPIPPTRPAESARQLDRLAQELGRWDPLADCMREVPSRAGLAEARLRSEMILAEMIAVQEELDWEVLGLYGLVGDGLVAAPEVVPPLALGERAFEIVLARRVAAGEVETAWFSRHRSTPITEIPGRWPEAYRRVVEARIERITSDRNIGLIERPECKRRWATDPWEERERAALRTWLLDRLEDPKPWAGDPRLRSAGTLADALRADPDFVSVAALYAGRPDPDLAKLVTDLVADASVPFLAALRYTDSGLRKRAVWERTWDLQRAEDRGGDVGTIDVPPKYAQADFARTTFWRLRGKLDVPKERFVSYPHSGRDNDPTPLVGWAGWDHRQQALALAAWLVERRDTDGWDAPRLTPLLAGLAELIPWVVQWHNDPDPNIGQGIGDYLTGFLSQTLLELGLIPDELTTWRPPTPARGRRKKA